MQRKSFHKQRFMAVLSSDYAFTMQEVMMSKRPAKVDKNMVTNIVRSLLVEATSLNFQHEKYAQNLYLYKFLLLIGITHQLIFFIIF